MIAAAIFSLVGKLRVYRRERSALRGAWVLAANHISHFDPPLLSVAARRRIDWMAMKELFVNEFVVRYFELIGTFPTDRNNVDRASVKTALQRLKAGRVVGMFPEGGIRAGSTSVLEGAPMRPGAGALAQMAGVPVVPCVVLGSDRLYRKAGWRPFAGTPLWVGFGEPIYAPEGIGRAEAREYLERKLAEAFKNLLAEMTEHFKLSEDDLPKTPQERMTEK